MTSDSVLHSPESDNPSILLVALRYLAARCDGAHEQDGAGFNKPDAWLGKKLADHDFLNEDETVQAFTILPKYAAQLAAGGITLPEREKTIAAAKGAEQSQGNISYDSAGTLIRVSFPYNPKHIATVKAIKGARFFNDGDLKYWTVPIASGKPLLEAFPMFRTSDEERAAILAFQPSPYVGKIVLEEKHLAVYFEYDADLVALVKTIKGAKFDKGVPCWEIPIKEAASAVEILKNFEVGDDLRQRIEMDRLLAEMQAAKEDDLSKNLMSQVSFTLPSGRIPYKHQKEAVNFALARRYVIMAMDMGTGKSMASLIAAKAFNLSIIVICPASLKINWQREAELVGCNITVVSWAKIPKPPNTDYVLIADEAHYAQNYKSLRAKAFIVLADHPHCMGCFALTGTPIKNGRPVNLFPILKAVRHPLAENKSEYEKRYCNAHATRFTQWDTSGASNLDELHEKLKDVMIRRMKKDCLDLPDKTRVIRPVELSDKAQKVYDERFAALRAEYRKRLDDRKAEVHAQALAEGQSETEAESRARTVDFLAKQADAISILTNLRNAGSIAKSETAIELAEEVIEQGGQIVLFVAFKESGETIAQALGVPFFSGELTEKARQAIIDDFQKGQTKAFVGTIQAGGVGVTLTAAQTVVLVDRLYTPGDATQAEDRLHRIGQKSNVTSIWLQCGSADIEIDEILEEKEERISLILQGKRKSLRGIGSVGALAQAMLPHILEE